MKRMLLGTLAFIASAILIVSQVESQPPSGNQDSGGQKTAPQSEAAKIDPKADECLKAMSSYLASLKSFSFQAEELFDEVDDGQKIQFSNERSISVSRPNKVYASDVGDTADSRFYYDGKMVTVNDRRQKTYATVKAPGAIDAMLDELHDKYDTDQTLADFLFADPYKVLTENVQSASYIGLSRVGKTVCHHLAFRQKTLDWQIWIETGDQPLPRKFLITFKNEAAEPQYVAVFQHWEVNPKLAGGMFEFSVPEGVHKVDFLHRHADVRPIEKKNNN